MANNYLQFSEFLDLDSATQADWFEHQLAEIVVIDDKEWPVEEAPEFDAYAYRGLRFLRDYEGDPAGDPCDLDFQMEFRDDAAIHVWFYAEESGDPGKVAHLVQKFLKEFAPDQYWSLTYATTCSKPRIGEFGGGAVFVTANGIFTHNSYAFVAEQQAAFAKKQ